MPGSTRYVQGNVVMSQILYLPLVTVPNLPANSTVAQTFAVPGVLPNDTQAKMYNALTPLFNHVTNGDLATDFKSEKFGTNW